MHELNMADLRARIAAAADRVGLGARLGELRPLEGGVSSLTFAVDTIDRRRELVVKVAPPGLPPVRNRDVLRQADILRRLAGVDGFPVPAVLFTDAGDPPLFAMSRHPGDSYEPRLDVAANPPTPQIAAARFDAATTALARLHHVDPLAAGLAAEPVVSPAQELERWHRLYETVDDDLMAGQSDLRRQLAAAVPAPAPAVIQHGDYRCANMLFVGGRLEAVIDWEIWAVGDPRADLAWLLMHTDPPQTFHESRPAADVAAGSLVPSAEQVLDRYLRARAALGAAPGELRAVQRDLGWFVAVSMYKTASTIAAIAKRERRSARPNERLLVAARRLDEVIAAGLTALSGRVTA